MKFGEILKTIRLEKKDSLRGLAGKMGLAFTYIDKVERGESPSKNFFDRIVTSYPDYAEKLTEAYCAEVLPEKVFEIIKTKNSLQKIDIKNKKIKFYRFNSKGNGILQNEYIYEELVIPVSLNKEKIEFGIIVNGDEYSGFYNNDKLLIEKTNAQIEELNKKIVIIKIKDKIDMRRVNIVNYTPFLESLNELYKPIEFNSSVKIIGEVTGLLYRDLKNIKF